MFDDFYGLEGKPFQLTPDPEFYFRSITHRKALSYLGYGLAQGEGFIVITGEVGAGKSTLVAHMTTSVDRERLTVAQIVTSKLNEEEIIHVVAQSFGLDIEGHDKASALGAIEGLLHEEARAGRRCLLVVDESQNLSVDALEELRMLSNFQLGNHPLLQTLLLGQPEFRTTLQQHPSLEQLRQRVIAAHHLEPMEKGEIEPYIFHRLMKVGWNGNPAFDQRVFTEMYDASGGIPRRVNQIANRLLLLGAVEERSRIDSAMLKAVLEEMEGEKYFPQAAPAPMPRPDARQEFRSEPVEDPRIVPFAARVPAGAEEAVELGADHIASPAAEEPAPAVAQIDLEAIDAMLAERDSRIAELQRAVADIPPPSEPGVDAARIDMLLSDRDAQIAELRQALANIPAPTEAEIGFSQLDAMLTDRDAQIADLRDALANIPAPPAPEVERDQLDAMLAERDAQIAELRDALSNIPAPAPGIGLHQLHEMLADRDDQIAELRHALANIPAPAAPEFDRSQLDAMMADRDAQIAELREELANIPLPPAPEIERHQLDAMLAYRDTQITELQQAIVELSSDRDHALAAVVRPEIDAMQDQLARLDAKLVEQEQTIRQTLTMLIEWIEGESDQSRAA
ncbi:AAA family ATPase [Altererythrobacter xixiisoli]|uniref:AAA family ATPase n=1 Tax=Croceibacterium xixiisoli TaxID=1476466 RepID=A0A6I4TZS2_9SPHN|nr:AAA family ATPase [Croceibacterium xixiisoli]